MSVYHNSFSYLEKNSQKDFNWIIAHFDNNADTGETDTFLSTSAVYSESYDGSRRTLHGVKYDAVVETQITVIKQDGTDFGVEDNRKALRWLTGSRQATWMDLYSGEGPEPKYRLLGRVSNVTQYKMDARIVGLVITFESVSPYGYSSPKAVVRSINGSQVITIDCDSDDLYSYIPVNIKYKNTNSGASLTINNQNSHDIATVSGLAANETITLSDNMMITSDNANKTFGNTFNYVFPRLVAGENNITVEGTGTITFQYIAPVKLGNIAIDLNSVSDPICNPDGEIILDTLDWSRIVNTPKTIQGYGITNAYTKTEVDQKIQTVNNTLTNEYFKSTYIEDNYYSKTKVDELISQLSYDPETGTSGAVLWSQIVDKPTDLSGYGIKTEVEEMIKTNTTASNVDIDEAELDAMLTEVLGE
jgi:hypothetical protein